MHLDLATKSPSRIVPSGSLSCFETALVLQPISAQTEHITNEGGCLFMVLLGHPNVLTCVQGELFREGLGECVPLRVNRDDISLIPISA